jgi:hypothetical protein
MRTIKQLRESIQDNTLDVWGFQIFIRHFAENYKHLTVCEEMAFKEWARKGAEHLKIDLRDVQSVFKSNLNKGQ